MLRLASIVFIGQQGRHQLGSGSIQTDVPEPSAQMLPMRLLLASGRYPHCKAQPRHTRYTQPALSPFLEPWHGKQGSMIDKTVNRAISSAVEKILVSGNSTNRQLLYREHLTTRFHNGKLRGNVRRSIRRLFKPRSARCYSERRSLSDNWVQPLPGHRSTPSPAN